MSYGVEIYYNFWVGDTALAHPTSCMDSLTPQ